MRRYWTALLFAAVVVGASACDVRIATEIVVQSDYSGELVVSLALDEETAADLMEAGFIPQTGLADAVAASPDWTVEPIEGLAASVRISRAFSHVDEVEGLLGELSERLGPEDGSLWDGLRLHVDDVGAVVLEGSAGLVPPTVAGAVGDGVTFDGEDLGRLLDEQGREAVRHDLRVTSSGRPGANNADVQVDHALVWELPVGSMRSVSAVLPVKPGTDLARIIAVAVLVAAGTAVLTLLTRRRQEA